MFAGQKSGILTALDPDNNGTILWQTRVGKGGDLGGIHWGPATDGETVYAAVSDIRIKEVGRDASGEVIYGADPAAGGGLSAVDGHTGKILWHVAPDVSDCAGKARCSPAQSAAVTAIPGAVFSGSVDGHLRAYSSADGKILWDFDTAREFQTLNDVRGAHGGSMDASGPIVAGGVLYVVSGYDTWGGMSGNVLLAFEPAATK